MESITPEYAVKRASWFITIPTLILFLGSIAGGSVLMVMYEEISFWGIMAGFVIGIIVSWIYWIVAVVKWKQWAYSLVDDIASLKEQAIAAKIIYPDNHFLNKTELKSAAVKLKLEEIEKAAFDRLKREGVKDDTSLDEKYPVYYSKASMYTFAVMGVLFIGFGIWTWIDNSASDSPKGAMLKYLAFPAAIYFLYEAGKRYKLRNQPLILFTDFGLYLYKHKEKEKFHPWTEVGNMQFVTRGKNSYLNVYTIDGITEYEYDFSESQSRIHYLHRIYKNRHRTKNPELYTEPEEFTP